MIIKGWFYKLPPSLTAFRLRRQGCFGQWVRRTSLPPSKKCNYGLTFYHLSDFSLEHTASYCLTASSSLQGIAKASFVSALASSVGSQSRCPHRQWSFHPLRFLNGLFTPFGSPVSRGTETFPGWQKPSKTDTLLSEIIRKSDKAN